MRNRTATAALPRASQSSLILRARLFWIPRSTHFQCLPEGKCYGLCQQDDQAAIAGFHAVFQGLASERDRSGGGFSCRWRKFQPGKTHGTEAHGKRG